MLCGQTHIHTENKKEIELLSCTLPSIAFQMYLVTVITPNAPSSLLPLQNICPDTSPKLLKALMKLILDMPKVCAPPSCKMHWSKNTKTETRTDKIMMPGLSICSGPRLWLRPGRCTELSASLLTQSTPSGVTRFTPWHLRQKATQELNLNTNRLIRLSISLL